MTFIDTSYLVALIDPSDELHHAACQWSTQPIGPFVTSEYVLVEFLNRLSKPPWRVRAHMVLDALLATPRFHSVPATSERLQSGVTLHRTIRDKSWSLTDCISFQIMREREIKRALTFDHHFEQAGFEALLRQRR